MTTRADLRGAGLALGNMALGLVLLLGHPSRTSGASFSYLRELGDVRWWGLAFVVAGAVALAGALTRWPWTERVGHFSCGFLCLFLVSCFWAARHLPGVSLTGIVAYATIALGHLQAVAATVRPMPPLDGWGPMPAPPRE